MEMGFPAVARRLRNERRLAKRLAAEVEAILGRLRAALGDETYDRALAALSVGPGEDEREN